MNPIQKLEKNIDEVKRLQEVHKTIAGGTPGRKHNVEVLNKSAIVLLVACWEAFVEDLAIAGFEFMLKEADTPGEFPTEVLTTASKALKDSSDNREVWKLAGEGWRSVLETHRETILKKYVHKLNTPKPAQLDALFKSLLGVPSISSKWTWHTVTSDAARTKLEKLVELRGSIAHRVAASEKVQKYKVEDYMWFVYRLAVRSSNSVRSHTHQRVRKHPWPSYRFRNTN